MNKKNIIEAKIFECIKNNEGISSTIISKYFNITKTSIVSYLNSLIEKNLIYKSWNAKNTRYFILKEQNNFDYKSLLNNSILILQNDYEIDIREEEILKILDKIFLYLNIWNSKFSYSINAFVDWCKDSKRAFKDEIIPRELARYISNFLDIEKLRKKSWFFDWTESMIQILSKYTQIYLDKIYFCEVSEISWFWRTKTAIELYFWKQNSDINLIENAIKNSLQKIKEYVLKNNIDIIIFTPPTIARPIQFNKTLKEFLNLDKKEILVSKIISPWKTLIAQKFTKWEERIINAESSINIENIWDFSKNSRILIFDDNFTTWSTINAIAKKLRFLWFENKIEAITITWKFHYNAIIDMDEI